MARKLLTLRNEMSLSEGVRRLVIQVTRRLKIRSLLGSVGAIAAFLAGSALAGTQTPLAIDSARITVSGTSNIHAYTASTTEVRVRRAQFGTAAAAEDFWESALRPGGAEAFEVAIAAATLTSSKDGLDKNMHKALKVREHPDIIFRLARVEPVENAPGLVRAIGVLLVAGVEREVVLDLKTERRDAALVVQGEVELLMTDFGIKPPKAMLGMLSTDPKVTVRIEAVFSLSTT